MYLSNDLHICILRILIRSKLEWLHFDEMLLCEFNSIFHPIKFVSVVISYDL